MDIQVLVTTMNCKDFTALYNKMNIPCSAVIANQCGENSVLTADISGNKVICVSRAERGVSANRNRAIAHSTGDILIVGDDDVRYDDNSAAIIKEAYDAFPGASIILFDVFSLNPERESFCLPRSKMLRFDEMVRFAGFQITFKRSVLEGGVCFNEDFGAGNAVYANTSGEDMLFLAHAYQNGHKIAYCKKRIGVVEHAHSTWKHHEWERDCIFGHGALFAAVSRNLSPLYILYYAFAKYPAYKNTASIGYVLKTMFEGRREYINTPR